MIENALLNNYGTILRKKLETVGIMHPQDLIKKQAHSFVRYHLEASQLKENDLKHFLQTYVQILKKKHSLLLRDLVQKNSPDKEFFAFVQQSYIFCVLHKFAEKNKGVNIKKFLQLYPTISLTSYDDEIQLDALTKIITGTAKHEASQSQIMDMLQASAPELIAREQYALIETAQLLYEVMQSYDSHSYQKTTINAIIKLLAKECVASIDSLIKLSKKVATTKTIVIKSAIREDGTLIHAVTDHIIADTLEKYDISVPAHVISIDNTIKRQGNHTIKIVISSEIKLPLTIKVIAA